MKKIAIVLLLLSTLISLAMPAAAARPSHGTDSQWVTEDMLTAKPPTNYRINPATQGEAEEGKYNAYFLKDKLQTVSIDINTDNLNYLLQNAKEEPYVMTNSITIGNQTLGYCGLRTKGNFTLAHAYDDNPGSDRFSFTINFGKYVNKANFGEKQTFFGCDKISFNNFFFDKSMMKEFFALMLMEEMGLPTPQFGLAKLYINGEYYGVYAMVEAMDESILEQHFGTDDKNLSSYLCKPTGTRLRYSDLAKDLSPMYEYDEETKAEVADMLPTVLEWSRKLGCLAAGTDFNGNKLDVQSQQYLDLLAQVMDIDETVKYFAVHSWLCQLDNMFVGLQNFGLYISPDGISTLLPWDYDLAFGCYFPSTAENTANYPVDVMYRLNVEMWNKESQHSANFYKTFPLFYVIYQSDVLMEQYHQYMVDCSRIAALGGYAEASGKSYDAAWFNSFIETLEQPLMEAASEKLAKNVYYMNYIQQPKDVKNALPNLTRIISQRAVGVYNQIAGKDTWVCGSGCNLETLGNAIQADSTKKGNLTLIDPYTGIFATANFQGSGRSQTPVLGVGIPAATDSAYQTAQTQLQPGMGDQILVYQLKCAVKATGSYTVTIPLDAQYVKDGVTHSFYLLVGQELTPITAQRSDNLFTLELKSLGTVVILADMPTFSVDNPETFPIILAVGAGTLVLIGGIAAVVIIVVKKKRK